MLLSSSFFAPQSIAVFGSIWAKNVIEQCVQMNFKGDIFPIHPRHDTLGNFKAYSSLTDLPYPPDIAFVGVNRYATVDIVSELKSFGAKGVVCFSSGWAEAGEIDLQNQLLQAAAEMPLLGPNCYGFINYLDGALLWPEYHGGKRVEKGVAIISQSSNIAINISMQTRGLPIAYIICLGNGAQMGMTDIAQAILEDERVTALGFYIEDIDNPQLFSALTEKAHSMNKGIVALKSGKTPVGSALTASHTASLASDGISSSAFLNQIGVAEVETPSELIELLKIFHIHGPLTKNRFCSLSCSGGEATLVADLSLLSNLEFPPPSVHQKEQLTHILGEVVSINNPLDYHTFIWGDEKRTTDTFVTMLSDYDAGIFIFDFPRADRCDRDSYQPALNSMIATAQMTQKPIFIISLLAENLDEELAVSIIEQGVVPLMDIQTGLIALSKAVIPFQSHNNWRPLSVLQKKGEKRLLFEDEAKLHLKKIGIPVPPFVTADSIEKLKVLVENVFSTPFVLKGMGIIHKTENDAVRLGLSSLEGEKEMMGASSYLAEEMITGEVASLLVGLRRHPVFGATLTLGAGGVMAELLTDVTTKILPVTRAEILQSLKQLKVWKLLTGYRGQEGGDVNAVIDVIEILQQQILKNECLVEIELNPLCVRKKGVFVLDALIWEIKNDETAT